MSSVYKAHKLLILKPGKFEVRRIRRPKYVIESTDEKSAIGKAISYTLNLWPRLIKYLDDGRFQIDNNLIENTIRPGSLGRKNYLFAGSHDAAQYAAIIYSLLACCKLKDVEPFQWLTNTLNTLPNRPENQLHTLLPRQK
jgi:transposase